MQYSGRFVIPFIVLGKSERVLPAPFFSTQIPIIEVESGRVIEIDGGGRDKAQRPCSLAGFLEGFRLSLIRFSKEVAGWKRTDWARGRTGAGTPQHLVMERLPIKENIKWTHIPFQGGGPAIAALLGGHVEAASQTTEWKKHVESGTLRLLAVYGEKRMADFPNAPTLLELGYGITAPSLISIVGPKGLSPQIVATLHGAFKKAMEDPDFVRVSRQVDQPPMYQGPDDLGKHLVKMNEEVGALIKKLGIQEQ